MPVETKNGVPPPFTSPLLNKYSKRVEDFFEHVIGILLFNSFSKKLGSFLGYAIFVVLFLTIIGGVTYGTYIVITICSEIFSSVFPEASENFTKAFPWIFAIIFAQIAWNRLQKQLARLEDRLCKLENK